MTRQVEQWLITAPQETFEAITAVTAERSRQEEKGWTTTHDDERGVPHLLGEAYSRLAPAGINALNGHVDQQQLIEIAALLIAAIESQERASRSRQVGVES